MPRYTPNEEFCPVARSVDVLGERWSLLIVRDLITGPKRFTDLQRLVVGITPKWLSARLRALTQAGVIERSGHSYALTEKGRDLQPVLEELVMWATRHDLSEPQPGQVIVAEHELWGLVVFLNRVSATLAKPTRWLFRIDGESEHTIRFDGRRWHWQQTPEPGAEADLLVTADSQALAVLLSGPRTRQRALPALAVSGRAAPAREFKRLFALNSST